MPQTLQTNRTTDQKQAGSAALDRLQASIDAAQTALKDLRGEVSRDSRDLFHDLGTTVRHGRRNLARSRRRLLKDLEQVPRAMIQGKPTRRPRVTGSAGSTRASSTRSRSRSTNSRQQTAGSLKSS